MLFSLLACTDPSVIPQAPVTHPLPDETVWDVILIGGGASGLSAAKRLIEIGRTPLIIEQQSNLGGSGLYAGRYFGVDTPWQSQSGIDDSVEMALDEWTLSTECQTHPALEDFITESASILNWIGAEYFNEVHFNSDVGWRIHPLNPEMGKPPIAQWAEELQDYALTNTKAIDITHHNGGYRILTDTGQRLLSKNIIVATGGFGRNIALIQEVYPSMTENLWHSEAWPYAHGSGLELLSTFASVNPFVSLHVHGATDPLLGQPEVMIIGALSKALIVNQAGERLYNEEDFEQIHFGASQITQNSFYALFDAPLWSNTAFKALSFNHPDLEDQMFTSSQYEGNEAVSSAETWTQLATKIGIDSDRLDHTVQTYNSHIQENLDPLGKDLNDSPAIGLPPLYALPLQYSTGRSFNGVRTNENMQVCNETKCHQGLYAVGEIQGLMCASEGGYNGSITAAIYSGYTAANHIGSIE